jgi:hypothetical protein
MSRDQHSLPCAINRQRVAASMSSELATARAEVKAWERSFKQENGREPTVDDIRKQPAVGASHSLVHLASYKSYKSSPEI